MDIKLIKIGGKSLLKKKESVVVGVRRVAAIIKGIKNNTDRVICVLSAIGTDTDGLVEQSEKISRYPDPVMYDLLVSLGEQKSIALVGMALVDMGVKVISLTGWQAGIKTTDIHTKASIQNVDVTRLKGYLSEYDVILIAGFQGITQDKMVTTLGRGGSDTTAVSIAIKLGLDDCTFLKDVRGVYTGDPKKVPTSQLISEVSHEMLMEVASSGAEIINIRAAELAKTYSQNLSIRNIDEYSENGTMVKGGAVSKSYSVISNDGVSMVCVVDVDNIPGKIYPVLSVFEKHLVKVSYIDQVVSKNGLANVIFLVNENSPTKLEQMRINISKTIGAGVVVVNADVALVSVVSDQCLDKPGIVYRVLCSLSENNIHVLGVGTSEIKVTFTVGQADSLRTTTIISNIMEEVKNEMS